MPPVDYTKRRAMLFKKQNGLCYYCKCKMINPVDFFSHIPGLSKAERRKKRATLEHLIRKVDGGTYAHSNIVLACAECNSARQDRTPEEFLESRQPLPNPYKGNGPLANRDEMK